ncbi:MAG: ABC transporter permease subunit, partial [Lachnospiraceae bacterium]|nr:ABC transporter permease subunit [Lachnospiraceae bacterium]
TGISLMLCFVTFLRLMGLSLSFYTILLAHITFNIPYVILSVLPKINKQTRGLHDAALDLGATEIQAFFKITLPELMPGILSGFMLSLTMSLDDFIITHFTKGAGVNTLSTLIYSQVRRGVNPSMYALSTIIFFIVLIVLIVTNIVSNRVDTIEDD